MLIAQKEMENNKSEVKPQRKFYLFIFIVD